MKVSEIKQFLAENQTWAKKSFGQHFLIDENVLDKILASADLSKSDRVLEIGPGLGVLTERLVEKVGEVVAIEADGYLAEILSEKYQIPNNKFQTNINSQISNSKNEESLLCHSREGGNLPNQLLVDSLREPEGSSEPRTARFRGNDRREGGNDQNKDCHDPSEKPTGLAMTDNNITIQQYNNLSLIQGDALKVIDSLEFKKSFRSKPYKVVANIPYSITSKLLRLLLEEYQPTSITFLVQKEVAERVCARAGEMSMLSLSVQYYGQPKIIATVPRGAFWPPPKVESAILQISTFGNHKHQITNNKQNSNSKLQTQSNETTASLVAPEERSGMKQSSNNLFKLARIGFSAKRKMLVHNLSVGLKIERAKIVDIIKSVGLKETVRAQELSVKNWEALARSFANLQPLTKVQI